MTALTYPPFLQAGDRVVLVSPSGAIDRTYLNGARKLFRSWGLETVTAKHAAGVHGHYAGSITQRLGDLQAAMDDDLAKVIFCSRGGYGAVHLVDKLRFTRFAAHPKWLVGFSDITALHNLFQLHGYVSLHAPMARHLTEAEPGDYPTLALKDLLFGHFTRETAEAVLPVKGGFGYRCPTHKLNHRGSAEGILRGGNLAVLYGLRGTPYDIPPEGTVLFIEDVGERPHAVERMLYNLKLGGVLERLSGLIVGQFTEYTENLSLGKPLYEALADVVKGYGYPVCFGFPVGHIPMNLPLINGAKVSLEVGRKETRLNYYS